MNAETHLLLKERAVTLLYGTYINMYCPYSHSEGHISRMAFPKGQTNCQRRERESSRYKDHGQVEVSNVSYGVYIPGSK